MKKVLITGFDPFHGETINPAYESIKLIPNIVSGASVIKFGLPTVFYESITQLEAVIKEHNPDIVICVGQAGGRYAITPERVAINQDDARIPDNKGQQPIDEPIFKDGENAYFSTLPIKKIVQNIINAGIPASISNSAGTFVCNHVMYGLLYLTHTKYPNIKAGFIHVPYCTAQVLDKINQPSLTLQQIADALTVAIRTSLTTETDDKLEGGSLS